VVKHILIPGFIASLLLLSCNRDIMFADNRKMTANKWPLDVTPSFIVNSEDTAGLYDISFYIRTGNEYPFRNIWLFVTATSPSGRMLTDTLEYMLADIKGKRYGDGFGNIRDLSLAYRKGIFFPETGSYTFTIRHGMRTEVLPGVYDFGIIVRKTGLSKN